MVKNENKNERDANKYFWIMKLALDLRNNKLMVQVLNSIQVSLLHEAKKYKIYDFSFSTAIMIFVTYS